MALRVGLDTVQPSERLGLPVSAQYRCDHRLEVCLAWGERELAPVARIGDLKDMGRERALVDEARVVDEHADPRRDPDPVPPWRVELGRGARERRAVDRRQETSCLQVLESRGVLREDNVGWRTGPLRDDLSVENVLVVASDRDVYPGRLLECGDEGLCRLHVLAVVERERHLAGRSRR